MNGCPDCEALGRRLREMEARNDQLVNVIAQRVALEPPRPIPLASLGLKVVTDPRVPPGEVWLCHPMTGAVQGKMHLEAPRE